MRMVRTFRKAALGVALTAVALLSSGLLAEVSVELKGVEGIYSGYVMMGGDHGDPWPWGRVRDQIDAGQVLNEGGDLNGDGPAAFSINPQTGFPEVVWAWFDGSDHEIALSRWDGTAWTSPELLTDNSVEDLDPAIDFAADGTRKVTWWQEGGTPQVWYRIQGTTEDWQPPERVTAVSDDGSRPDVADDAGLARVTYQLANGGVTEIVVSTRHDVWEKETIASTAYAGPAGDGDIDPRIHVRGDKLWVDWVDGEGLMAYCVFHGAEGWSSPQTEGYSWNAQAGETEAMVREGARVRIRLNVLRMP